MTDYKAVIEDLINRVNSLAPDLIEYKVDDTNVEIKFRNGMTFKHSSKPELSNESYRLLLQSIFEHLAFLK